MGKLKEKIIEKGSKIWLLESQSKKQLEKVLPKLFKLLERKLVKELKNLLHLYRFVE